MDHLQRIERDILAEHGRICLRPTVEAVRRVGGLLAEAKALVPYGQWGRWVRRLGIGRTTAHEYMAVAEYAGAGVVRGSEQVSVARFLRLIRASRRKALVAGREAERDRLAASEAAPDERFRVVHADCRTWGGWPSEVGAIATDPPWSCAESYRWLAGWAAERLTPGGLLMVQCGVQDLPDRMALFAAAGLTYRHTLSIVYDEVGVSRPYGWWVLAWRPVLVYSRGSLPKGHPRRACDVQTVRHGRRTHHKWEQPVQPWRYWIERLTPPGCVLADPFSGGGTTGVAVVRAGSGRRYLGTEVDGRAARVAAARIARETKPPGG